MLQTKPALLGLMLLSAFCQAVPGGYVALGDGYSSGFGSGNYDLDPGPCHRSSLAFPALWAKSHNQTSFSFAACNGASIEDVATLQLGNVSADTAIISLTIGADNVGLTGALSACAGGTEDSCRDQTNTAKGYISAELPGRLDALYNATRTKAPQAKIVVLGYPWLLNH
ncbi:hypothetical protein DFQ27_003360 [Actinomortierella ambigua]|uniref:SGNH hydrolase-type esterase domain-containing protein n=1 Tax=Actinomortierella ambigua TaxID=1343610 RepID=A0A9P6Q7S2_9FUNG|nr:hypothetical protein DFQ27_003360 [Actinomortierella ambigua]